MSLMSGSKIFLSGTLILLMGVGVSACSQKPSPAQPQAVAQAGQSINPQWPSLVQVHAEWCPACKNIAPAWNQLEKHYQGKVNFVLLDVSNPRKLKEANHLAETLGLKKWFAENQSHTSTVVLLLPPASQGQIQQTFVNEADPALYEKALTPFLEPS